MGSEQRRAIPFVVGLGDRPIEAIRRFDNNDVLRGEKRSDTLTKMSPSETQNKIGGSIVL